MSNTNEAIRFGKWLIIHTDEVHNTAGPCRRYKNILRTIDELYVIWSNLN